MFECLIYNHENSKWSYDKITVFEWVIIIFKRVIFIQGWKLYLLFYLMLIEIYIMNKKESFKYKIIYVHENDHLKWL